jgi:protein-tyrosine phosphatase
MSTVPVSVLFVCLGNICRSPLAEGIFLDLVQELADPSRYRVDSAGTGSWHVGEAPDPRARAVARKNGLELVSRGRQVGSQDLSDFDVVIAMDSANLSALHLLGEGLDGGAELFLLRDFDPDADDWERDVPDPYWGGDDGFDRVYEMIHRSCRALLEHLEEGES